MIKVIICGIGGKVGSSLIPVISKKDNLQLVAGIDKFASQSNFAVKVFPSFKDCDIVGDVVIDFSRPEALEDILEYCIKTGAKLVLSTTGHTAEQQEKINEAAKIIGIFQSSNMSLGVNLLINLSKQAARFFGNSYDIEIVEYHHNLKVDSPSGTALSIANNINEVFEDNKHFVYGRHGREDKRTPADLGIHAVRGGTIVGKHDVMFIGTDEIVTLTHEAQSRQVFAMGALRAAEFMMDMPAGRYSMDDVIGKDFSVTIVSGTNNVTLITLSDISFYSFNTLLQKLAENKINLDMISQTLTVIGTVNVSFTFEDAETEIVEETLKKLSIPYTFRKNQAKLLIEGAGMEHQYGIAASALSALSDNKIDVFAITTSETKIELCVDNKNLSTCEQLIRNTFKL